MNGYLAHLKTKLTRTYFAGEEAEEKLPATTRGGAGRLDSSGWVSKAERCLQKRSGGFSSCFFTNLTRGLNASLVSSSSPAT